MNIQSNVNKMIGIVSAAAVGYNKLKPNVQAQPQAQSQPIQQPQPQPQAQPISGEVLPPEPQQSEPQQLEAPAAMPLLPEKGTKTDAERSKIMEDIDFLDDWATDIAINAAMLRMSTNAQALLQQRQMMEDIDTLMGWKSDLWRDYDDGE